MTSTETTVIAQPATGPGVFETRTAELVDSFGMGLATVYGYDELPTLPQTSIPPIEKLSLFPGTGGLRVNITEFPAGGGLTELDDAAAAEAQARLMAGEDAEDLGMHMTDSIDVGFILKGEIYLATEGAEEKLLKAGDVTVQLGAKHAWINRSPEPCLVGFVVVGLDRA